MQKSRKLPTIKNEVKRSWKLKNAKVGPVIVGAMGMMTRNLTEILITIPGNIITNELQLEAVRRSVTIVKRAVDTKTLGTENFTAWSMNHDPLLK